MTSKPPPRSENFTYHELAEGVWAAIVISTGLAASNSGILDLGDSTLIFDTTLSPASAAELRTVNVHFYPLVSLRELFYCLGNTL